MHIFRKEMYNLDGVTLMEKPSFTMDQIIQSSVAAKHFGAVRKQAQITPVVILDNGAPDSVLMNYVLFEQMFQRLQELEEKLLVERIERAETDPASIVSVDDFFGSLEES
jgi:PHD/YefM family antitoxin component YafN of YafNO toxin-antitoxin module